MDDLTQQAFSSGSKALQAGSPVSPGHVRSPLRGYAQESYDPLNDTRQINKSYEDIRSNHQRSIGSNRGRGPHGDPQGRRQS